MKGRPFHVVEGVPPPETPAAASRKRVKAQAKPARMAECVCGSRSVLVEKTGVLIRNGKPSGGTAVLICSICLAQGRRVVVT